MYIIIPLICVCNTATGMVANYVQNIILIIIKAILNGQKLFGN